MAKHKTEQAVAAPLPVTAVAVAYSHSLRVTLGTGEVVDLIPVGLRLDDIPAMRDRLVGALGAMVALARRAVPAPPPSSAEQACARPAGTAQETPLPPSPVTPLPPTPTTRQRGRGHSRAVDSGPAEDVGF